MNKWFYERSKFAEFKSNTTYHELLGLSDTQFVEWARLLRKEVTTQWDEFGTPPVIGADEEGSLGLIQNFNKDASVVNQFFPTMLKTKISIGKSADNGLSIYDHFADPDMEEKFVNIMKRAVKRDSMYSWSRSIVNKKDENPFWDGQTGMEFIQQAHEGKIFNGKYSDLDLVLAKVKDNTMDNYGTINDEYSGFKNLYLSADDVNHCVEQGWLNKRQISNLGDIVSSVELKSGKKNTFHYLIRWYNKTDGIFPKILQVFRLSCGQPAVNFPALTAKYIYETYTSHVEGPIVIYDSSSGWGGRIIGAMSSRKKTHYVGTDPNPDTKGRYEAVANGSELIGNNPEFQKYKGKFDIVFTSPPYFNREQYSQDENQSFKAYNQYEDWRKNFLYPTLKTAYEYLKPDRYILWNIASIKIGKDTYYDLEGDSKKILQHLGCEYKGKLKMLMTRMVGLDPTKTGILNSVKHQGKAYKYEPIFVFYKPKELT